MVPIGVDEPHQRDVDQHQGRHGDELLAGAEDQIFQLSVDHSHIRQLADDGSQGAFQAAVCLACHHRLAPLLPYLVVDGVFQVVKRGVHIRVDVLDAGQKPLKHILHRVVQVSDIFLHCLLKEASGCQLDIPERSQHETDGQYGDKESIPGENGDAGAQGKQSQRSHAHHRELLLTPGCGQHRLRLCDLPAEEARLFSLGCFIDIRPDAAGSGSQPGEDAVAHLCGGDPQRHKKPGDHADAGDQLDHCHAVSSFLWMNCSSSPRGIPFSIKRRCRLSDISSHFW